MKHKTPTTYRAPFVELTRTRQALERIATALEKIATRNTPPNIINQYSPHDIVSIGKGEAIDQSRGNGNGDALAHADKSVIGGDGTIVTRTTIDGQTSAPIYK